MILLIKDKFDKDEIFCFKTLEEAIEYLKHINTIPSIYYKTEQG